MNLGGFASERGADCLIRKHVLIVDDVMTTGATLEAYALELLKVPVIMAYDSTI